MAIRFTCPCGLTLEAEDQYAGQLTVCPQCKKQKKIPSKAKPPVAKLAPPISPPAAKPAPAPPAEDPGFEVVEDDEPIVAAPKATARPPLTMRGDDRPVRKKGLSEDDRPRKAKVPIDDEDDDQPRKRRANKKAVSGKSNASKRLWKILGGAGLVVVGIALVALWWFGADGRKAFKLLIWGIVAAVLGLGGIGAGMFGNVGSDSYVSDSDDDDFDDD